MATDIITFDFVQALVNSADRFPVDLDDAFSWLGYARKENALRKLKKHFFAGEDFNLLQVEEVRNEGDRQVSRKVDKYYLTVDCFKEMGMLAGTEQGKLVRKYYLQCERIVKEVIPSQGDRIRELELELQIRQLDSTMIALHGEEVVLALRGTSQVIRVEVPVTEIVEPETGRTTKILTAAQLKEIVKRRTGQNLPSLKWFADALRSQGRDDLLIAVNRHVTSEYPIPEKLDEAIALIYGCDRQTLLGEP